MSAIFKLLNFTKNAKAICNSFTTKALQQVQMKTHLACSVAQPSSSLSMLGGPLASCSIREFHRTCVRPDLMEFFDDKKNWTENEIKVGRAWKKEELRIKSNKELHQLWYILLKERNMLLTMEHECNEKMELFPSPERLDKVKISMRNLEDVVRERNKAYHLLETGTDGERPTRLVANPLGIKFMYKSCEHVLPAFMNQKYIKSRPIGFGGRAVRKFLLHYREKLYNEKRKAKNRSRNEVMMLLRRYPNFDSEVLRRKFPNVDIDKLKKNDKVRGHFVPKIEG